ncbi:SDR family NAD(P)-dependent oxidoreductase [Salinibacillus xinjiangensis]|uniref:SDR family NAD(P)-dependent oxidoreductase n=1 Tax=Salinibacillus xinjiangensis TaxID=1229268 RepID=A0A6G1X666_9BACI|nr:SDR family oxidoreductase [Salinibacillus xinjiangensis]MRG86493.1 SDR family NAD(P)-dependent oxidoreductase [Salinibacillus xinjiangensis]
MIRGKNIVITGASSGIGMQLAYQVSQAGATPILVARSREKLQELVSNVKKHFAIDASYYVCDVSQENEWKITMEQIVEDYEQIHVLVNNAGFGLFKPVTEMKLEEFDQMYHVNVHALIQASHFFAGHMLHQGEGHIMNVASQAGKMSTPKAAGYAATKHAVLGFTHGLRMEVENEGIFVTAVNLGPVKTNFFNTADPGGGYAKSVDKFMLDPTDVAQKMVSKLYQPVREINLPLWMEWGSRLYRLFPGLMESVLKKQFRKK